MADFGMAAKVRPALLLTGEPAVDELTSLQFYCTQLRCAATAGN
jgi:hypothetical protein